MDQGSLKPDIDPGATFLGKFGEIEQLMRQLVNAQQHVSMPELLRAFSKSFPRMGDVVAIVRDMKELRNFIAHGKERVGRLIPTAETLHELDYCIGELQPRTKKLQEFSKRIDEFTPGDRLIRVLRFMHDNDFSQVALSVNHQLDILTAIDITNWLTSKISEDLVSIEDALVSDVLAQNASTFRFDVLARNQTIGDAEQAFGKIASRDYSNLFCVFVTQTGKLTEKPLAIITPWDLMNLSEN